MSSGRLNDWLQVIGQFALVASLIFVGLQMRQTQAIALSQAYQARADQSIALTLAGIESDTTLSYWAKVNGFIHEELTPQERALEIGLEIARLQHWENMYYQYQQGFVSQEHWDTQLAVMKQDPRWRSVYEIAREFWRSSFRTVLDQILATQQGTAARE